MMPLLQKSKTAARDWLQGIDTALLRTVAAAAALCMLLAHGFAFTNLFPNHDSTVLVFDAQWTMYVLGAGRRTCISRSCAEKSLRRG